MFNDPDRLISSTKRINKNVVMSVSEKGGEGGLPDASGYKDGTALIAVGGKFIPVEGYAYSDNSKRLDLEWDTIYHADDPNCFFMDGMLLYKMSDVTSDYIPDAVITGSLMPLISNMSFEKASVGVPGINIYSYSEGFGIYWVDDISIWDMFQELINPGVGLFFAFELDNPEEGKSIFDTQDEVSLHITVRASSSKFLDDYINAKLEFKVVNSLPDVGENGIIYLVRNSDGDSSRYDEYVWIASESRFEKLGPRQIDISGKVDKTSIRSGTTEYEDGVTNLPTGALYFQYEV